MSASAPGDRGGGRRARVGAAAIVMGLAAMALWVRSFGVVGAVVREDGVYLQGADAWHHLRQIEQLVRHFPRRMTFDPFALHPGGQGVAVAPLFDWIAAVCALVVGAGSPSERTVAAVTAWLPAILGAATCVPAFLLARRAAGRAAGLLAAVCVAVLPGQFLSRTRLGFADHHALEALLAPCVVLAIGWALGAERRALRVRAVIAGLVLLLYLFTWTGGALLVLVLATWVVLQINVEHGRRASGSHTALVASMVFGVALIGHMALGWDLPYAGYQHLALTGAFLASAGLGLLGHRLAAAGRSRVHLPMATLAVAAGAVAFMARVSPDTLRGGWHALTWFAGSGLQLTVGEAAPLLRPNGEPSLHLAWAHYGTVLPGALIALVIVARRVVREGRATDSLLGVWSAAMLLATLGQNRFGYYFAVCAAVLCGVLVGPPLARLWSDARSDVPLWIRRGLWPAAAVIGLVVPVAPVALATMHTYSGPRQAWIDALRFLRTKTPEPLGAGAFERLYARDEAPGAGWGVLSWWDGGYWITAAGHRIPAANPTQAGAGAVARLLLDTNPEHAADACRERGLRYVLLDGETPMLPAGPGSLQGELGQVARWADIDPNELFRTFHRRAPNGEWRPMVLFTPAYFETLAVRLHVFGGTEVVPRESSLLVRWRETSDDAGGTRLEITEMQRHETFERAAKRLHQAVENGETDVAIFSDDPLRSCVPLSAATSFRQVFASRQPAAARPFDPIPDVQIYAVSGSAVGAGR